MIINEQNHKKPFISMKDLKIPVNRISENGMLFHPETLISHFRLINYEDPDNSSKKLVDLFKAKNPFKVTNTKESLEKIPLGTSFKDNLSKKHSDLINIQLTNTGKNIKI